MNSRHNLDGMWEFLPLTAPPEVGGAGGGDVPRTGYDAEAIRVPGYWNTFPDDVGGDWGAYDHYGYPEAWQEAESAWYRLRFQARPTPGEQGARTRLHFDAVAGRSTVWLNRTRLGENADSFLPFSFDVSEIIRPGDENELVVLVEPPPKVGHLWLQPCGSWVGWYLRGIWQSVYLQTTPRNCIDDVFVQPSVRRQRLAVDVTVSIPDSAQALEVRGVVLDRGRLVLDLGGRAVSDAPAGPQVLRFEADWPDARCWSPDDPHLYHALVELRASNAVVHRREARFGFREFWIEGTGFRLNGRPIRLFGDSWHYMGVAQQNPAYARTWYEFAKQTGVNAIRTHAMPYPPFYFDVADEMGMLIIDESAVYGSAGTLAYDDERFWANSRDHLRRLVLRDRNHPSIIFWSACNETVWKGGEAIFAGLVSLAEQARALDPTRPISFDENDCDLRGRAPLHAGHYGTPQHWQRSWKRDRPLVVHEFCALYHGGPNSVCAFGNDAVYADYLTRLEATGRDAADMFCRLRSLGAASITPWNLNWYCLEPLPVEPAEHVPAELTSGGAAIRRIGPRALTLNYGYLPNEPAWRPNSAYAPLAECYKRRRFFLQRRLRQGFDGQRVEITPEIWNDCDDPFQASLALSLRHGDETTASQTQATQLAAHDTANLTVAITLPDVTTHQEYTAELILTDTETRRIVHTESWTLHIHPRRRAAGQPPRNVWFVGGGDPLEALFASWDLQRLEHGAPSDEVTATDEATLILAGQHGGRTLADWLRVDRVDDWVRRGGRLVVLPDGVADDAGSLVAPIRGAFDHAFVRDAGGALLDGLGDEHFRDWGDDGVVARAVFQRPATGPALAPLDVGDPAEGMARSPLVIIPRGCGHVALVGLDLPARIADTPAAAILFDRLVHAELRPEPNKPAAVVCEPESAWRRFFDEIGLADDDPHTVIICDAGCQTVLSDPRLASERLDALLAAGGTLLIQNLTPQTAAAWSQRLGIDLSLEDDVRYNVARTGNDDGLPAGLNNFDLCWVDRDAKCPIVRYTLGADRGVGRTLVQTVATRWEDYQSAAEQHKVAMMYRRMASFAGPRAAVVEIARGPGRIIISQLLLAEASGMFQARARRIMSRWLDAIGVIRDAGVSPLTPRPPAAVRADGFIAEWPILGPFAGPQTGHSLDHPFVDEKELHPAEGRAAGGCTWRRVSSAFPQIDLGGALEDAPAGDRVAYAAVYVYAPQDRSVLLDAPDMIALLAGADGGSKVLLNGRELGRFDFVRELVPDSDRIESIPLRKGWNTLVIKLHNPSGPWRFTARLVTAVGEPAADLRCQTHRPR
ncbi:MAG: hypothetical protein GY778_04105 [bacterium]|nr:hypothetical protein [bacterium]